jgi:hypothetical protein
MEESGAELIDALGTHSKDWEQFLTKLQVPSPPAATPR